MLELLLIIWQRIWLEGKNGTKIDMLTEIKPPYFQAYESPTGKACPDCGSDLTWGQVMCPDGHIGCLVMHYGYNCGKCGKQFR